MLDLMRKEVMQETLDAHVAKLFGTGAAADWLSKRLWTRSSFMEPIATFVRHKKGTTMEDEKYINAFA